MHQDQFPVIYTYKLGTTTLYGNNRAFAVASSAFNATVIYIQSRYREK